MSIGTLFLRNRPLLECMCHLLQHRQRNSPVKITVLGCSKGAEVYSISFALRSAQPELDVAINAVDISNEVIEVAKAGVYSLKRLGGLDWPDESLGPRMEIWPGTGKVRTYPSSPARMKTKSRRCLTALGKTR